ncbi:MAG: beta-N-acetylhexosaminidase [Acholeplasmataceae bacterium]|nr:MAG: beta-N-acetylhexosaminidase [Acholeplasmataceae bacterium]
MKIKPLESLTLQEKVGQLLMFGFDGYEINDHARRMICDHKAGNVILFARNIKDKQQLKKLVDDLQALALEQIGVPLFISIDQEGGMVIRIRKDGTHFPGAMTMAAAGDEHTAYDMGRRMGRELAWFGINMDFAPVLDVNNNPSNPVIGVRSFSDNPDKVAAFGSAFASGLQEHVIATGKHFPGHGDTHLDSHLALPTVTHDLKRLESVEFKPFKFAIDRGIKAIMSSHIVFPAIDPEFPATLSHAHLTELLRGRFGFKGLIATDCMQMKAIRNHYSTPEASLMAVRAGANILCVSHDEVYQTGAVKRLFEAVSNGELDMSIINDRVALVLAHKTDITWHVDMAKDDFKANGDVAAKVVRQALTKVKGSRFKAMDKTLLVVIKPLATSIADESDPAFDLIALARKRFSGLAAMPLSLEPDDAAIQNVVAAAKDYPQVIICSYNANVYKTQLTLIRQLTELPIELHVVAMRNPYDLFFVPEIEHFVCTYEHTPNAIAALLDYLDGKLEPEGRLPVHVT